MLIACKCLNVTLNVADLSSSGQIDAEINSIPGRNKQQIELKAEYLQFFKKVNNVAFSHPAKNFVFF